MSLRRTLGGWTLFDALLPHATRKKAAVEVSATKGSAMTFPLFPESGRSSEPVGFHNVNVARSTRADMQRIPHSITSSARVSMVGGTSTPIAFKVGRLRHC